MHGEPVGVVPIDPDTATAALAKSEDIAISLRGADRELRAGATKSFDELVQMPRLRKRPLGGRKQSFEVDVEVETVDDATSRLVVVGSKEQISDLKRRMQQYGDD